MTEPHNTFLFLCGLKIIVEVSSSTAYCILCWKDIDVHMFMIHICCFCSQLCYLHPHYTL